MSDLRIRPMGKKRSRRIETRSVGFAHESSPKFQTASFTQHFRGQSPRYHLRLQGKMSSEKRFSVHVGRILESDIFKHFRHNQKQ